MQIDGLVRATDPDLWRHLFVCQAPLQWALAPAQVDSRLSWEGVGGVGHYFHSMACADFTRPPPTLFQVTQRAV